MPPRNHKTFTLLSIGQRGVGKTVFLAASCSRTRPDRARPFWFECRNLESQERIDKLLNYMVRTGEYPPATASISSFYFTLQGRGVFGRRTLCHFRWQDVPGEICHQQSAAFQELTWASHGCCIFFDAQALLHEEGYFEKTADIRDQALTIARLAAFNHLRYPFAIVLTKCDQLQASDPYAALQQKLQVFVEQLQALGSQCRGFLSGVNIRTQAAESTIEVQHAAEAFVWLASEIYAAERDGWAQAMSRWLAGLIGGKTALPLEPGVLEKLLVPPTQQSVPIKTR
ncbi:hypothetical protein [Gloeobacter kilaueensis]|uniref:Uncharacterized protein n=1 Tax=Gloeobacter kilaueensis (strain ATCC BAA-2537 / CCAP 1431/1 / ULC 316 / JS1) TaxID=1183438 RepID=U5QLF9_GLOK1|nr:hypothetical protein [Gloeobacter kilaueensis]AGY58510.1 hypothetical protein GKIL_2264 [Gloeobacter kilaueensis JS1]